MILGILLNLCLLFEREGSKVKGSLSSSRTFSVVDASSPVGLLVNGISLIIEGCCCSDFTSISQKPASYQAIPNYHLNISCWWQYSAAQRLQDSISFLTCSLECAFSSLMLKYNRIIEGHAGKRGRIVCFQWKRFVNRLQFGCVN